MRRRLQSLERTWDLLDELDAAPVGEPFTQTTLEMVAVAAHEDAERDQAEAPRRRRRRLLSAGGGLLAAAAAGFLAVALSAPDPNRQLLEDLPVLENFDEYRQVESIEFLHELRDKGSVFHGRHRVARRRGGDSRGLVRRGGGASKAWGPTKKSNCCGSKTASSALAPEEQQRLRRLRRGAASDPDAQRLRAIMHRYGEWLKTLSSYSRAELAEMKPAERVAWIRRKSSGATGSRRPSDKDMDVLLNWMNEYVERHEKHFLETLPERQRRWLAEFGTPGRRHGNEFLAMWQHWQGAEPGKPAARMTAEDLSRLRARLSPETQKRLEALPPAKQWQLVAIWIHQGQAMRHSVAGACTARCQGPTTNAWPSSSRTNSATRSATCCWVCRARRCSRDCSRCI